MPENQDPGPQWDPTGTLQKTRKPAPGTLVGLQRDSTKNRKNGIRNPRRTLVGPQKNRKTGPELVISKRLSY